MKKRITLKEIKGIGEVLYRRLRNRGITSVEKLAQTKPSKLREIKGFGKKSTNNIKKNTKRKIKQRVKEQEQTKSNIARQIKGVGKKKTQNIQKSGRKTDRQILRASEQELRKAGISEKKIKEILKQPVKTKETDKYIEVEIRVPIRKRKTIEVEEIKKIKLKKKEKVQEDFIPIIETTVTVYATGEFTDGNTITIEQIYNVRYTPDNIEKLEADLKEKFYDEMIRYENNFNNFMTHSIEVEGL